MYVRTARLAIMIMISMPLGSKNADTDPTEHTTHIHVHVVYLAIVYVL